MLTNFHSRSRSNHDIRRWWSLETHWWPYPLARLCDSIVPQERSYPSLRTLTSRVTEPFHLVAAPGRAEERVAKLVDSPDKPESEASYKLDEGGWADV